MLRRFMNWLLHQLQKVLGVPNGRRSNSRPSTFDQSASDAAATQKADPAIADTSSSTPANISFSIPSASPSAQQAPVSQTLGSQTDAIQKANETTDTHLRLDAASFTVPGSPSELSDAEVGQNDPQSLNESIADIQPASQLPSIHDLLPAVEQEIKANSAYLDEEAAAARDSAVFDSVPLVLENNDPDEIAEPEQALLFSFDIIESTSREADSVLEDIAEAEDIAAGNTAESGQLAFSPPESAPEETLLEIAQPPQPKINLAPDAPLQPLDALESKADLPYPWSMATPRKAAISEDKPLLQSEGEKQTNLQAEADGATTEPETVPSASNLGLAEPVSTEPVSAQPASVQPSQQKSHPVKNGVVKLLFTMKEGNFHGYIEPEDGSSDILFHQKYVNEDIFDSLERGIEVVVSVEYKEGKAYATRIELA